MNLISFSLFGSGEKYNRGMVENARLAPLIYPGWRVRVYVDDLVTVTDELRDLRCEVVQMPRAPGGKAMCWRFLPASNRNFDRVIVRDADSRLNAREAAAVDAWIESGKTAHIMRDHEHHRCLPIFGGMWGIKGGSLPQINKWIDEWPRPWRERMDDMDLLATHVWPVIHNDVCHHTSVENRWGGEPFPSHEPYSGFVGMIWE